MEPPLRSIFLPLRRPAMSGNPASGRGDASGPGDAEAPAKEIQILETLRAMRQLVTFSPDDLQARSQRWRPG